MSDDMNARIGNSTDSEIHGHVGGNPGTHESFKAHVTTPVIGTGMPSSGKPAQPRGRLIAYARWQLMDFVRDRSFALLLVGLLLGIPLVGSLKLATSAGVHDNPLFSNMRVGLITGVVMQLLPVFTLITINKIVAGDRSNGYYRFLFAKPISVRHYYAQLFVLYGIGMLACVAILCGVAYTMNVSLPILPLIAIFAITYVAMGGIGFLFSVFTRFDWQAMLAVWFGAFYLQGKFDTEGTFFHMVTNLLPPAKLMYNVTNTVIAGNSVATTDLLWYLGYGVLCCVVGVMGIRYRQLAS